jgi:hypothetical protein
MIFTKPTKLNGTSLTDELAAVGIIIDEVLVDGSGQLILNIADKDKAKAQKVISDHKGLDIIDPAIATKASAVAKLAALGLTADEAKLILG